ncbi:MAG: cupin domain-containing protein [SAR202 cluster bacterium]|nr:cupin domain-containing protein [SAR202 cluster bacterium]|tara:strand:- start:1301 stop:1645 length:345 start_codon:yes stop_codon:yes gene_type:complete
MTILNKSDAEILSPGVKRHGIVSSETGSDSLSVAEVNVETDSTVPTHLHPTEEAMFITEGQLEAVIGDEIVSVSAGQTVYAPAGIKHGFRNISGAKASILAIFPTGKVERTLVD